MKVVYTFEVEIPGNEKEEFDPKNFPRPRDVLKKLTHHAFEDPAVFVTSVKFSPNHGWKKLYR